MNIIVAMRQLADLVEELEVDSSGTDIDREFLKFVSNEWDEAALEEALCLKEAYGGTVTVVGIEEVDFHQTLHAALAKGADRAVELTGDFEGWIPTRQRAAALAWFIRECDFDLVLTGVQAADDLNGQLAGAIGAMLGVAHASVVTNISVEGSEAHITQELGGGVTSVSRARLPLVLGVQSARQAPRYVPISRIRQVMAEATIEKVPVTGESFGNTPQVLRLYAPEASGTATMLEGKPKEVAHAIYDVLVAKGVAGSRKGN